MWYQLMLLGAGIDMRNDMVPVVLTPVVAAPEETLSGWQPGWLMFMASYYIGVFLVIDDPSSTTTGILSDHLYMLHQHIVGRGLTRKHL